MLPLATPALPLDEAGRYVAGAYVVFLVLIVVYVAIMAAKLQRIERELRDLAAFAEDRAGAVPTTEPEVSGAAPGHSGTNTSETASGVPQAGPEVSGAAPGHSGTNTSETASISDPPRSSEVAK